MEIEIEKNVGAGSIYYRAKYNAGNGQFFNESISVCRFPDKVYKENLKWEDLTLEEQNILDEEIAHWLEKSEEFA